MSRCMLLVPLAWTLRASKPNGAPLWNFEFFLSWFLSRKSALDATLDFVPVINEMPVYIQESSCLSWGSPRVLISPPWVYFEIQFTMCSKALNFLPLLLLPKLPPISSTSFRWVYHLSVTFSPLPSIAFDRPRIQRVSTHWNIYFGRSRPSLFLFCFLCARGSIQWLILAHFQSAFMVRLQVRWYSIITGARNRMYEALDSGKLERRN